LSLEGLLALLGIMVALYALAPPVQRHSVPLFASIQLVALSILVSAGLLIWRSAVMTFYFEFYPWSDFASQIGAFLIPVLGVIFAYSSWRRAKLTAKKDKKFRKFIQTSIKENKFDESLRILAKNEESIGSVLERETLYLIFERRFIESTVNSRNWIHLKLLSNKELIEKLTDKYASTNNLMRVLLNAETSPMHSAIVVDYGGSEYLRPTKEEGELIEKTLQNPEWYMKVRADYPLIISAHETVASGELDEQYNQKDDLYAAIQGESTRLRCPIYLALKTHVLMLKKAIETKGEGDYYVSDLRDLFKTICEHSKYNVDVWEDKDSNWEYPTPFAYLLKEIIFDLRDLCRERKILKQIIKPPGRIGTDLVGIWATCVSNLGYSREKVSDKFKFELVRYYLIFTLESKKDYEDFDGDDKQNIGKWCDLLVEKLKRYSRGDKHLREVLFQSMNGLDLGKDYTNNEDWLRRELDLPERPGHSN